MNVYFIEIYDGEDKILNDNNISYGYSLTFWKVGVSCGTKEYMNEVLKLLNRK
jgi:hypothetical protein